MLDIALNAQAANAHGVVIGNSRDMTMTVSGGVAQGSNGARAEVNASIPMFNVAKSNADAILQSMSQTTNEGGSTYTKCEIALPSIDSGTAIVSDQSQHTGASGTTLPPTQIRLVLKNPKTNQNNNADNLEDANKKKEGCCC